MLLKSIFETLFCKFLSIKLRGARIKASEKFFRNVGFQQEFFCRFLQFLDFMMVDTIHGLLPEEPDYNEVRAKFSQSFKN